MKKLISILLLLVLLVGCSNSGVSTIQNKDEVLFKIEDKVITKGNIYSMLRFQGIASELVVTEAQKDLVDAAVEETDELLQKAKDNLQQTKDAFGDYFKIQYGEATDEELIETMFLPAAKQEKFINDYFVANKDAIVKEKQPVKAHVLYFDDVESAQSALDKLNTDTAVADVIKEFGSQKNVAKNKVEPAIVAKASLPAIVASFIDSEEGKLLNWTKAPLSNSEGAYLVKLIEADSAVLADDYQTIYLSDSASTNELMNKLFNDAKFEVYDQAIYDSIKNTEQLQTYTPDN